MPLIPGQPPSIGAGETWPGDGCVVVDGRSEEVGVVVEGPGSPVDESPTWSDAVELS